MQLEDILEHMYEMGGLVPTLGIELEVEGDELKCRLELDEKHMGAPGIAHGGTIMALLDSALGFRAMSHALAQGKATSTVELKVNFLRPARQHSTLVTSTTIQSAGRSLLVLSGTAVDEQSGEQIAFAVGTFNLYSRDKFPRPQAP